MDAPTLFPSSSREAAQAVLDHALNYQREAKKRLEDLQGSIRACKADVMAADARVLLARSELARFSRVPSLPASGNGRSSNHGEVRAAVTKMLAGAGPNGLTTDQIFDSLQAQGIAMGGEKPRQNLNAYLSRWDGIKAIERGRYTVAAPSELPAFLAPPGCVQADEQTDEQPGEEALPTDFPHFAELTAAGLLTYEAVEAKTRDQLRRIRGVGATGADAILAALEPVEA